MENSVTVRDQMFAVIAEWEKGKLSQKAFCDAHQIRFHYWYKRYRALHHSSSNEEQNSFIPLTVEPDGFYTEVVMPTGVRIIFHQPVGVAFLQQLIK